jgi:carbonic anhydrase
VSLLQDILNHNAQFVESKGYELYTTSSLPDKRLVVLTCMDTRLTELLPRAMNLRNGDAKIIKTAGAVVSHPFGSSMRSILVAVYQLKAEEVMVVGHEDCGMAQADPDQLIERMKQRGISEQTIQTVIQCGVDLHGWLRGFGDVRASVARTVENVKTHPLMPRDVPVHGLVIHPATGKLDVVVEGYSL